MRWFLKTLCPYITPYQITKTCHQVRNLPENLDIPTQSGIIAHSMPSTFAYLKAMMLELHQTMPLLNIVHLVADCPSSQYRNSSICALFDLAQLTRTPNYEGKRPFVVWCTCQLSLAGDRRRQGALRRCRTVNNEKSRQPG